MGYCRNYHEFNLDWFISRFKELENEWQDVKTEWKSAKEFINNKLSSIPEEIRKIFAEMLEDGSLEQFIKDLIESQAGLGSLHTFLSNGGKKVLFLGDSICNGYGWWTDNKSDENDGIAAIWRKKYPGNSYTNLAVNRTTLSDAFSDTPHLSTQLAQITQNDYDLILIICGINDITKLTQNSAALGLYDNYFYNEQISDDFSTVTKAISSTMSKLHKQCPNAKIVYIIPPSTSYNVQIFQNIYKYLNLYAWNYGAYLVNGLAIYKNWSHEFDKKYMHDQVHPNEEGYKKLEELVIQTNFQQNQIAESETEIIYLPEISLGTTPEETALNLCNYVETNAPLIKKTYMAGNYFAIFSGGIYANVSISKSFGVETYFKISFHGHNYVEYLIEYNEGLEESFLLRVTGNNSPYQYKGAISNLSDIYGDCCFLLDPNNIPKKSELGLLDSPYVLVNAKVSYNKAQGKYYKQVSAIITQTGYAGAVLYIKSADPKNTLEKYIKLSGTVIDG